MFETLAVYNLQQYSFHHNHLLHHSRSFTFTNTTTGRFVKMFFLKYIINKTTTTDEDQHKLLY